MRLPSFPSRPRMISFLSSESSLSLFLSLCRPSKTDAATPIKSTSRCVDPKLSRVLMTPQKDRNLLNLYGDPTVLHLALHLTAPEIPLATLFSLSSFYSRLSLATTIHPLYPIATATLLLDLACRPSIHRPAPLNLKNPL